MTDKAEAELEELWRRHRVHHDSHAREQLILHHAPLVRRIVGRMGIMPSSALDYQDLVSHGISGLIEAIDRFDPARGFTFQTFASQRIRGSVLDAIRGLDHVSRLVRRRSAEIAKALADLRATLGRIPTDQEIAGHLGMDIETYYDVLSQANIVFLSLDSPFADLQEGSEDTLLGEALEDSSMQDVMAEVEERDLWAALAEAIQQLPQREQLALSLYYYEELTVREVGEVMSLSPSRVSQLMARAIMSLRAILIYDVKPAAAGQRMRARQLRAAAQGRHQTEDLVGATPKHTFL